MPLARRDRAGSAMQCARAARCGATLLVCCAAGLGALDGPTATAQPAPATGPAALPLGSDSALPVAPPADAGPERLILDVRLNGQAPVSSGVVLRRGARLLFAAPDMALWRLRRPATPALSLDGADYHDLLALPGVQGTLDEPSQTVNLTVAPEAYEESTAQLRAVRRIAMSPAATGAILNYELALQRDRSGTRVSGYVEAIVSGEWGTGVTSALVGPTGLRDGAGAIRLDTAFRRDDPERLTRLTLGDAITRSAAWSTPFRFGGVQFGTQFGLQPGYISYPTPSLRGSSALPSALEVYVNDTLRYQGRAEAGPFDVPNVPVLTGAGELRFAITDALGVQRSVTTPYYVSSSLLRAGLSDYSLEAGWTRRFYGSESFAYGRPFGAGTWRRGFASGTLEWHGEAGPRSQTAGGGFGWVIAPLGEFSLHAAASRDDALGAGRLVRAAFARTADDWSFAASRQTASRAFTQIGRQDSAAHVSAQSQLFAGRTLGRFGALGGSYTQLRYSTGERIGVLSASWSVTLGESTSLAVYAARTRQDGAPALTSLGMSLTVALGERQAASLSAQRLQGRNTWTAEASQATPGDIDGGIGYRLRTAGGDAPRTDASVERLGRYGTLTAEAASFQGERAVRLRASGAVGTAGGLTFAARQSDDAFALVTVPDTPGLKVYRENQHLATTDGQGRAIVPGLRAYEPNRISIDSEDLPIDARIGRDALEVVPRYKGVAAAAFEVTRDRALAVTVQLPAGQDLLPGIDVQREVPAGTFLSGYGGAVSIDAPAAGQTLVARWRGGACRFTLRAGTDANSRGDAGLFKGPYRCQALEAKPP